MRQTILTLIAALICQPTSAQPVTDTFRPVSFVCRDGATGTSVRIDEDVLGNRRQFEVSYFNGKPTFFVISYSRVGRAFKRVGLIDLRSATDPDDIDAARYLSDSMGRDASRFCKGSRRAVLAARYELQANHWFNRSHPQYTGK